ncbi:MAG: Arylsulfatase [Paenibacillaceae bacterium]|jgi:choline-sulfatase|nr:Arylsulfatase [Paenibacillaceae bacterium]
MSNRKQPNILLLYTDQQRADTIHALGNELIQTPTMDRLVREGTAFTRAYTPSPVCVPGRCSMYYGQYPWNSGCYDNGFPMPDDRSSMFQVLKDAGYRTHAVGKLHFNGKDQLRGLESRDVQEEGGGIDDYKSYLLDKGYDHVFDPQGQRSEMYYMPQLSQLPAKDHPTQWVGDRSLDFIRNHDFNRPFFLMSSYIHPHPPFAPPTPWNKLYRAPEVPHPFVPDNYQDCLTHANRHQNRYKYRDQGIDRNMVRTMKGFYYACISFIDYQIGRILQELEAIGQLDNTLILLSSDHGEMLGDYNSFGKRTMLDAAANVPLLARFPERLAAGVRCEKPANLVDIMPTAMDAAGIAPTAANIDGVSLFKLADGTADREVVYSQYQKAGKALYLVASEHRKYIYSAPDDKEYYFDHAVEKAEATNLALTLEGRRAMSDLKRQLVGVLAEKPEAEAVADGDWKKYPTLRMPEDPDEGLLYQDAASVRDSESVLPPGYVASFPGQVKGKRK